jgi:hypothetical protein
MRRTGRRWWWKGKYEEDCGLTGRRWWWKGKYEEDW